MAQKSSSSLGDSLKSTFAAIVIPLEVIHVEINPSMSKKRIVTVLHRGVRHRRVVKMDVEVGDVLNFIWDSRNGWLVVVLNEESEQSQTATSQRK